MNDTILNLESNLKCEDEPIHIPETIQSFGYFFAINPATDKIEVHSDNMQEVFSSWEIVEKQQSFFQLLNMPPAAIAQLKISYMRAHQLKIRLPLEITFKDEFLKDGGQADFFAVIYESTGYMIVEVEPAVTFQGKVAARQETKIYSLNTAPRFNNSGSVDEMAKAIADLVRGFSGFERVLIYKFNEDQSGLVIAESKVDDIESYLGLYYPESDIPKQARELYKKNWIRITANAASTPVKLIPSVQESKRKPIDLSNSLLRSMSPVHLEYLKNQGLKSSMSLSLYSHDNLWGLVICQHRDEYYLPQDMRLEVEGLAHLFSWQLYAKDEASLHKKREDADITINEMIDQISSQNDIASIFEDNETKILDLMGACGFIFNYSDMSVSIGEVPSDEVCRLLLQKSEFENKLKEISIDNIYEFTGKEREGDVLGALLLPLLPEQQFYTTWFRKEHVWTRKWAGNPEEKHVDSNKMERLRPRKSFIVHNETVKDSAIPWSLEDKRIADLFNKVFLQHALRSQVLMQSNIDLLTAQDRSRNEFLATLAHELRNPLAPISTAVELLRMDDEDLKSEAANIIERQISQLTTLIDDLMDVSRITRGRVGLNKETLDLNELVKNAYASVRPIIEGKEHKAFLELSKHKINVSADVTRLTQVISNVLSNAAKYTPHAGEIHIRTSISKTKAIVTISDNGLGIDAKYLPNIFQMFSQADPFSPKGSGGLGIGLTLAKKLIELHDGKITAKSAGLGTGSTFQIRLPLLHAEVIREAEALPQPSTESSKKYKVLVVDDNVDSAHMLKILLGKKGHDVISANSGTDGLHHVVSFQPDLVLLDIGLPDIDGYEVCQAIRAMPNGKNVVVVAQTGWGQDEHLKRSKEAGFDRHLVKPIRPAELFKIIDDVILNGQK